MQQMASSNGSILPSALSASKSNLVISDPIPGAKPLPVPPELAPFVGVSSQPLESLMGVGGWSACAPTWCSRGAPAGGEGLSCWSPRARPLLQYHVLASS